MNKLKKIFGDMFGKKYLYKIEDVANYLIDKSIQDNKPITPDKLQKLLYFTYGLYLSFYNKKLFKESVKALKNGPSFKSMDRLCDMYGNNPITEPIVKYLFGEYSILPIVISRPNMKFEDSGDKVFIDDFWESFSKFTDTELSELSISENTPWMSLSEKYGYNVPDDTFISDDSIKEHFDELKKQIEK